MFSHMEGTLIMAFVLSGIVFVAALAAEGRGQHLLRILLRVDGATKKQQIFADVERADNDLRLVRDMARLEERSHDTTEIEVRAGIRAELERNHASAAA